MANMSSWFGPVLGAVVLIGGYVAYEEGKENEQHEKQCAAMKRSFLSNTSSLADLAIAETAKRGNQSAMGEPLVVGGVAGNMAVMEELNAQCPGWVEKQYKG